MTSRKGKTSITDIINKHVGNQDDYASNCNTVSTTFNSSIDKLRGEVRRYQGGNFGNNCARNSNSDYSPCIEEKDPRSILIFMKTSKPPVGAKVCLRDVIHNFDLLK